MKKYTLILLALVELTLFRESYANAKTTVTCREFASGMISLYGYYERLPDVYDKMGTYAYLCSKHRMKCSDIYDKSELLSQFDWEPAVYQEKKLKFECNSAGRMERVIKQEIDVNAWNALISSHLPIIPERLVNCHQLQDGTISLSGFFEEIGGIAYLCRTNAGTCTDFAANPSSLLDPNQKFLWSKANFSISRNRFYCRRERDKSDPTRALRGVSVNSSLWRQMLSVIYERK